MKGITPIIAIIVLLLITVALAGVAYSYLNSYMTGLTSKSIEVRDSFCVSGDTAIIIVANVGTTPIDVDETEGDILILNSADGSTVPTANYAWYQTDGTTTLNNDEIPEGGLARLEIDCTTTCSYRLVSGDGRSHSAKVTC